MKLKTALIIALVAVFSLLGLGTWGLINYYETKISKQEIAHKNVLESQRQAAEDRFNERVKLTKEIEDVYKNQISELESKVLALGDLNSDLDRTLDRLRVNERDLRSRLNKLSAEAKREYAVAATEAFREISEALRDEQLAHQETSRKADEYYFAWRALDRSWSEAK